MSGIDVSNIQAAYSQLGQVDARNAALREQKRQQRQQLLTTAAGLGLGAVAGPAVGLSALQGASLGASALPALARGDAAGVAQAGLGAASMAQSNAQQAQRAAAVKDIQTGLQGLKTQPEMVPGSQLGGQPIQIMPDNPDDLARQLLGQAPTEIPTTRPDATVPGERQALPPEAQRFNSYLDALIGVTPISPEAGLDILGKFALPQDRTARLLSKDEVAQLAEKTGAAFPEGTLVQLNKDKSHTILFRPGDRAQKIANIMGTYNLPKGEAAAVADGIKKVKVTESGHTYLVDDARGTAQAIETPATTSPPGAPLPDYLRRDESAPTVTPEVALSGDPTAMTDAELDAAREQLKARLEEEERRRTQ